MTSSSRRLGWLGLGCMSLVAASLVWISLDASERRAKHRVQRPQVEGVVRLLGTADLALSSASRWLRHPSLSEPGAPFADGPAILDADPAGALISPPLVVLQEAQMPAEN